MPSQTEQIVDQRPSPDMLNLAADSRVAELMLLEAASPVVLHEDAGVRVKATDNCGMTCLFCHNEGTPVVNPVQVNRGRVSIYSGINGVDFHPMDISAGDELFQVLAYLREELGTNELHWTGGEPTLASNIVELSAQATRLGFSVKMTSNGETAGRKMKELARAGLTSINFSIFGTTPAELAAVQAPRFRNEKFGNRKLQALHAGMRAAADHGIRVKANVVVPDYSHAERVHRILDVFGSTAEVRLLTSLDAGFQSPLAIYKIMADLHAKPVTRHLPIGGSGYRVDYELPQGQTIGFKQINRVTLPTTCDGCSLNNDDDYQEGYYGLRLYSDGKQILIGICIQRMDLTGTVGQFKASGIANEIKRHKIIQRAELEHKYAAYLQ